MTEANALLLLSIALAGCAGSSAHQPAARASVRAFELPATGSASRLGPPSPRGLGLRRVDRTSAAEPPLARY